MKARTLRIFLLLLTSSFTVMAGATIAPALPRMRDVFAATPQARLLTELVLTMPALFIALGAGFAGWIIDRFGRINLLLASLFLYGIAGSSGVYLNSLPTLLVGRAALGLSVAGVMTVSTTLIADYFEGAERQRVMGWQSAFMALGGVFFLTGGGALADWHWRGPFLIYLVALLVVPLSAALLYEPARSSRQAGQRARDVIPRMGRREIIVIYATAFFGMLVFYTIPVQLPFFLRELGVSRNLYTGLALSCMTLTSALVASRYGWLRSRFESRTIYAFQFGAMLLSFLVLYSAPHFGVAVLALVIGGSGLGLLMPHLALELVNLIPEQFRGRVVGGMTIALFAGQFASPLPATLLRTAGGIRLIWLGCAAVCALLVIFHLLRRHPAGAPVGQARLLEGART